MVDHVKPFDLAVEAVVDEPVGEVEGEVPPHRGDRPLGAHTVVEDAVEDRLANPVVIVRPRLDARRRGAERSTATAAGPVLAVGDVEEDDLFVGDGPDLAVVGGLAPPELAARRAGGLARGAVDGYGADVGADGLHSLRAPVGS